MRITSLKEHNKFALLITIDVAENADEINTVWVAACAYMGVWNFRCLSHISQVSRLVDRDVNNGKPCSFKNREQLAINWV